MGGKFFTLVCIISIVCTAVVSARANDCEIFPEQVQFIGNVTAVSPGNLTANTACTVQVEITFRSQHAFCPFVSLKQPMQIPINKSTLKGKCFGLGQQVSGVLKRNAAGQVELEYDGAID